MTMRPIRVAILTCSDSRFAGRLADTAGPALAAEVERLGLQVMAYKVVPDDRAVIAEAIAEMADSSHADVVLTTGGTGLSARDLTPEATLDICDRQVPGIAETIRRQSMEITRRAMLSRGVAALRGSTLVINLPGSQKGAVESFGFIADQLEHALAMIAGEGH